MGQKRYGRPAPVPPGGRGPGRSLLALAVATAAAAPAAGAPSGSGRAKRAYYTRRFDLGGLPEYTPGPPVTGTLRLWGLNYLKDGNLADYWEAGFRRYHPGVHFEYHLAAAFIAISGLVTGQADLGPCRRITFNEIEEFERMFHYPPAAVMFTSGSFDVPGWNNACAIFVNRANPLRAITVDQLDGIFGSRRDGGWSGTQWHPEWARGGGPEPAHLGPARPDRPVGEPSDPRLRCQSPHPPEHHDLRLVPARQRQVEREAADLHLLHPPRWHVRERGRGTDGGSEPGSRRHCLRRHPKPGSPRPRCWPWPPGAATTMCPLTLETVRDRTYPLADADYFYFNRQPGAPLDPKVREFLLYVLAGRARRNSSATASTCR